MTATKLSPIATLILGVYRDRIRGHENYLTPHMLYAELTAASHYAMIRAYPSHPDEPISLYVEAVFEVKCYLDI